MSDYHTQKSFDERMAVRAAATRRMGPPEVFYHAALMPGGWEPIVAEQCAVLRAAGLTRINSFVLASGPRDVDRFATIAAHYGIALNIVGTDSDFRRFEIPTLQSLHDWAKANPGGSALYFHTKGASNPADAHKRRWRQVMGRIMLAEWRTNADLLAYHDVVGADWEHLPDFPHFAGNFWAARCDWLAELPRPDAYQRSCIVREWGGHPWERMSAELWLGSRPFHAVFDRLAHARLSTDDVWSQPYTVTGVDYDSQFQPPAPLRLSVIVPTTGRDSLARTLTGVTPQLLPGDELIVQYDSSGDWGATPRTRGMRAASGDYLLFMDDDDEYEPGAIAAIRGAIAENPGRPHLFRMRRLAPFDDVIPAEPMVRCGNVSTQMFVTPNAPDKLGAWGPGYTGDYSFIASTLALFPPDALVWRDEIICTWRPKAVGRAARVAELDARCMEVDDRATQVPGANELAVVGVTPVCERPPVLHVITACRRPENLDAVGASVRAAFARVPVRWHVHYDPRVVPREGIATFRGADVVTECPGGSGSHAGANAGLEAVIDPRDWLYWLDDDTLMHPRFEDVFLAALAGRPNADGLVVGQRAADGGYRPGRLDCMGREAFDPGQLAVRRGAVGGWRFPADTGDGAWLLLDATFPGGRGELVLIDTEASFRKRIAGGLTPDVDGWFDWADFYDNMAARIPPGGVAVEVGVYQGKSVIHLALRLRGSGVAVHAVDTFLGSVEHHAEVARLGGSLRPPFESHLRRYGVADAVTVHEEGSTEAAGRFRDRSVDLVFIDASHDYESVRADILAWLPKVKPGGVLSGHDYHTSWPGVVRAVDELLPERETFMPSVWSWTRPAVRDGMPEH